MLLALSHFDILNLNTHVEFHVHYVPQNSESNGALTSSRFNARDGHGALEGGVDGHGVLFRHHRPPVFIDLEDMGGCPDGYSAKASSGSGSLSWGLHVIMRRAIMFRLMGWSIDDAM